MADVWQATDTVLARQVAVKILHPHLAADAGLVARFRTEAIAAARLRHPSIVAIFDTCSTPVDGGSPLEAIVMELVRGHTLRQQLDASGPLEPTVAIDIGADVADALQAAHKAGMVHRDIKPANILLCDDRRVMITDFGIAKVFDDTDHTQTGTMLGSVKYLSPEQVEGSPVDARTDVYSLGIVLYESLTGRVPFVADTPAATALARLHQDPVPSRQVNSSIPAALDEVIMRSIARDPVDRYATTTDLRSALVATRVRALRADSDPDPTMVAPRPLDSSASSDLGQAANAPRSSLSSYTSLDPVDADDESEFRPRRRWGAAIVVLLLIAAALSVAGILVTRTEAGQGLVESVKEKANGTTSQSLKITTVTDFDPPPGDGREGTDQLALAWDNNPTTSWRTEWYDSRLFGNIKKGVGVAVVLDRSAKLDQVKVTSSTKGWHAQVYVADSPGSTLADWGPVIAQSTTSAETVTFDLNGAKGKAVLLWITDLGEQSSGHHYTQVQEISVTGS